MGDVLMRGKLLSIVERDGVHRTGRRSCAIHPCCWLIQNKSLSGDVLKASVDKQAWDDSDPQ
jgi:hypothetical protein